MGAGQLAMRLLSSLGKINAHDLRTGQLAEDDWRKLTNAVGRLSEAPIHIDETPGLNSLELRARARRLHRQYGQLGLIVIDYLQLMSASSQGENRATEISEMSRSLKGLAKELNVPVVALGYAKTAIDRRFGSGMANRLLKTTDMLNRELLNTGISQPALGYEIEEFTYKTWDKAPDKTSIYTDFFTTVIFN